MPVDALLFDLDGTLIESNDAHLDAWCEALHLRGFRVGREHVRAQIGKGGDQLVRDLFGDEIESSDGAELRDLQTSHFRERVLRTGIRPTKGAEALLREARRRGLRTALATSSSGEQLELAVRASGVEWRSAVDVVVTKSEVQSSKPAPDLLAASAQKLGVSPAQCALLGDTSWDGESARRAGVTFIGVTCGGSSGAALQRAGARLVVSTPASALAAFNELLRRVAPGMLRLDRPTQERLMQAAMGVAEEALDNGEAPIGAIVARGDGTVIGRGYNSFNKTRDPTAHAEIVAFRDAAGKMLSHAHDTILISTLEPCVMCFGAAAEIGVDTVLYAQDAPSDGGASRVRPPTSVENQLPRVLGGLLPEQGKALFRRWLTRSDRNREQEPYIAQLLEST
jgi:HAD superfamily hydrolase (TIGR01509 family)